MTKTDQDGQRIKQTDKQKMTDYEGLREQYGPSWTKDHDGRRELDRLRWTERIRQIEMTKNPKNRTDRDGQREKVIPTRKKD